MVPLISLLGTSTCLSPIGKASIGLACSNLALGLQNVRMSLSFLEVRRETQASQRPTTRQEVLIPRRDFSDTRIPRFRLTADWPADGAQVKVT